MTMYLMVPRELAEELVSLGVARVRPRPRGTVIDVIVVGATAVATCVTLIQGPQTLMDFARALRAVREKNNEEGIEVHFKGRGGEIHLFKCDSDTPIEEIASLVKKGLLD